MKSVGRVVPNAWRPEVGGSIFADAPNAVTSAAATIHLTSTHQNITQLLVIRLSPVSSRGSGGFTITVQGIFLPVRIFPLLIRTR
jgi:hypothetical protein